jgi:hypothetical protein
MNKTTEQSPPNSEPSSTPKPVTESLDNDGDDEIIFAPKNEPPFPEQEINLNEVFPDEESDLNELFPDEETRQLLKKVERNKKDLHTMTDRFTEADWGGNEQADGIIPFDEPSGEGGRETQKPQEK